MSSDITNDQCIELAMCLDRQRSLHIVNAVAAYAKERNQDGCNTFLSGMEAACEEITERLNTEPWKIGDLDFPLPKPQKGCE